MSLVLEAIAAAARKSPGAVAIEQGDQSLTWSQLLAAVHAAASAIERAAPKPAPVAIVLDNGLAWATADLALMSLGRASIPLPPFFTQAQSAHAMASSGAGAIISHEGTGLHFSLGGCPGTLTVVDHPPVTLPSGTAKITFTSGSTGRPKGVCLSIDQMEAVAVSLRDLLSESHTGRHLAILPLGVLLENVAGLYATLLSGGVYRAEPLASLGLSDPFRPNFPQLALAIASSRATSLILVPELLRGLIAAKTALRLDLPDLTIVAVGGSRVSPALLDAALSAGLPVCEGYGLTESASVVALSAPGAGRRGAVGRILPHLKVEVGADGEIMVGPQPFLGYVGEPLQLGPHATGDLGTIDAAGFLRIDGRKSNVIINSYGRNISPEWVESELLAQPEIAQALVFGEAQPQLGALISPTALARGPDAIEAAVERTNAALPAYAQIARWRLTPPFDPAKGQLTGNGRPRRGAILAEHADFVAGE